MYYTRQNKKLLQLGGKSHIMLGTHLDCAPRQPRLESVFVSAFVGMSHRYVFIHAYEGLTGADIYITAVGRIALNGR